MIVPAEAAVHVRKIIKKARKTFNVFSLWEVSRDSENNKFLVKKAWDALRQFLLNLLLPIAISKINIDND